MSYKISQISDTHVRNLKYHREYRVVFEKMYSILREEKPDYIVHTGDLVHLKTSMSPELVEMTSDFLRSLSEIAPTYVILGNHDGNVNVSSRQDAISPIVKALNLSSLHLLKKSGEVKITDDLTFNVLSVFDKDNWTKITDKSKINIALYHGAVNGVKTDTGFVMEHGEIDLEWFRDFDYAMLGDIHLSNQKLDPEGRARYCGATIQNNFGETDDKGFLIWEIENKDKFNVRHISIPHPNPFFTIELTPEGKIPKGITVPKNARLRLAVVGQVPLGVVSAEVENAKRQFSPLSVTFYNKSSFKLTEGSNNISLEQGEDLRDIQIQERIIREYLKDYNVDKEVLNKVVDLNKKYHSLAEKDEEVVRNVRWSLKGIEWDNLFNYGEKNSIDFEKLNGVIGIFGKNFSGKSSVIETILWIIFNSTSKSYRKNIDIINQNKDFGRGRAEIQVAQNNFVIERETTKSIKQTRAGETEDLAKTELCYGQYNTSEYNSMPKESKQNLNGDARRDTDRNIRKMFGTIDDFLLTSMSSQRDPLSFVSAASKDRKSVLAKFLDLEIFDKKYKLANEDALELRGSLRKLEGRDFDQELKEVQKEIKENKRESEYYQKNVSTLKAKKEEQEKLINEINIDIAKLPELEVIDEDEVYSTLEELSKTKEKSESDSNLYKSELQALSQDLKNNKEVLETYDLEVLNLDKAKVREAEKLLQETAHKISFEKSKKERQEKQISLLSEVPCGDKFPQCKFLHSAYDAQKDIVGTEELIQIESKKQDEIKKSIDELNPSLIDDNIKKYKLVEEEIRTTQQKISNLKLKIERVSSSLITINNDIEKNENKLNVYLKNKEAVKNIKKLQDTKKEYVKNLKNIIDEIEQSEDELTELYIQQGTFDQKWNSLEDGKLELESLREQYTAYDLYLKCMNSNGIAYDIIKKRLPVINEQVANILTNVVDFEIFLEEDGRELPIMIKHPKYPPRSLSGGSGAELALAAMAIRIALIRITSLPVGDIFILDEPATSLDEENMEGFTRIIDVLKQQFKSIILISHLDALKDVVDEQIVIDSVDGYAKVNI